MEYNSQEEYETITGDLGMLREWKDGVPRGAYEVRASYGPALGPSQELGTFASSP